MAGEADMTGRTCMITGATNGVGKAAALALARLGAGLVLVGRNRERGERAVEEIRRESGNDDISLLLADLSSQAEIRQLAKDFLATGRPLHVLLNNAGVINMRREETIDGIEATFAVNHLAYFLLTELLLERLKESAPARIVSVSSDAHAQSGGRLDFDDLETHLAVHAYVPTASGRALSGGRARAKRAAHLLGERASGAPARIVFAPRLARREAGRAGKHRQQAEQRFTDHTSVADWQRVGLLVDLFRGRSRGDEAVEARDGAAGDHDEDEGEHLPCCMEPNTLKPPPALLGKAGSLVLRLSL